MIRKIKAPHMGSQIFHEAAYEASVGLLVVFYQTRSPCQENFFHVMIRACEI